MAQHAKSITLEELFADYDLKLLRTHKSEGYRKQFGWLKGYLKYDIDKKVSDLKEPDITSAFVHLPHGNRNSNLRCQRSN
jgi:hypothetical protein